MNYFLIREMIGGHFILQKENGFTEFTYIDDLRYSKFCFRYNYILILISNHETTLALRNGRPIYQDFSNLESNIRNIIIELHEGTSEDRAKHKLSIIWDKLVSIINESNFTLEMLNNVSFCVSPVKSARKFE
jgi:hypothetical protein